MGVEVVVDELVEVPLSVSLLRGVYSGDVKPDGLVGDRALDGNVDA